MSDRCFRITLACLCLVVLAPARLRAASPTEVDFNREIRPILSDRCFPCHGPDGSRREAELRLDRKEDAFRQSEYGEQEHVIEPGQPEQSELYVRIASTDDDLRMPPADSNLSLTPKEIDLIRRWIADGAPWNEHWAFRRPATPEVPQSNHSDWCRNPIDYFVLVCMQQHGLDPSAEASREQLIRRLSFTLTGLPPTPNEIDAFVNDSSPDAYERLVDRLLASPRFGERMAADWLDVARYSDTYGYQVDRERFVWPWRDWVIRVFNENLPYDKFLTWQLAGDLLPNATRDQILATTFNRLHSQKVEGGSVPEEFRVEYVADRCETAATAFLGLTLKCARCHDHKYDPLSQKEYYQFYAFFNNVDEAGLYSYFTEAVPTPTLLLTDQATQASLRELDRQISQVEREIEDLVEARMDAFMDWLKQPHAADSEGNEGPAGNTRSLGELPGQIAYLDFEQDVKEPNRSVPGKRGKAIQLTGDDGVALEVGNFRRSEPFSVALWMNTPDEKERAVVFHRSRAWTDAASRGYQLLIEDGRLSASLIHFWPGNAIRIRTREKIPVDRWIHVVMSYDGSSRADGLALYIDGCRAPCEIVRDHLYKNITGGGGDHITIGERFRDRGFTNGKVDEFRVFQRRLTAVEAAQLHDGHSLTDLVHASADQLNDEDRARLRDYYLSAEDELYRSVNDRLKELRQKSNELADKIPEIMVMADMRPRRPTFVLNRGLYDRPGEPVEPDTPAVLPPFPSDQPRNRLGLAHWMTDPAHPLTARIAVNHLWQICFGSGIVRTGEDLGSQGKPPTHPQLLDWLATDFVNHGWDIQRTIRLMVTSATYRQTSRATSKMLVRDPENLWLARAPSYQWPAEMLRDNALAVSGLLVEQIGGPPARPYELEVAFKPIKPDTGAGLYRRSLYTYWKRTSPPPAMMTLDAAKRDVCQVRRERTASPLQALVLWNGPQWVEAACRLGARVFQEKDGNIDHCVAELFRVLTSRRPTDHEQQILLDLYRKQYEAFASDGDRAKQFLESGRVTITDELPLAEVAAISVVANTLMVYDECVMRR